MDQEALVTEQIEGGRRLIEALLSEGVEIHAAFWAKPTDDEKWFLYLASDAVDKLGVAAVYRTVHYLIRRNPDFWIKPFEVRLISQTDPMAEATLSAIRPRVARGPSAVGDPKPYPGITRFGEGTLAGVPVDGAFIYPQISAVAV